MLRKAQFIQRNLSIDVRFDYDEEVKNKIKEFPGVTWNAEKKVWTIPLDLRNKVLDLLKKNNYRVEIL